MGEGSNIEMAIRYLREVSALLLVMQVLCLASLPEGTYLISISIGGIATLAAVLIKLVPSALLLAQQGRDFKLLGRLIKYCYWSSPAFEGLALPLLLAGRVSNYYGYWGLRLGAFEWLVMYFALLLQPTIFAGYVWFIVNLPNTNYVGVLGLYLSLTADLLVFIGWLGILLLLCKLASVTGVNDFQTSATLMICAALSSLLFPTEPVSSLSTLFWIAACYKLWIGTSQALKPVARVVKQDLVFRESEVDSIIREIGSLKVKVKEYEGYLLKLKQMYERGEVSDEVYQDLKNTYIKELEKYKAKLEDLMKKLEEEKGTRVKTVNVEDIDSSALLDKEHTFVYTPESTTDSIPRISRALPHTATRPIQTRGVGTEVRPAGMREDAGKREGPPLFLFLLIVLVILASIVIAMFFDPIFSIIILVLMMIVIAAGYHMGSQEFIK